MTLRPLSRALLRNLGWKMGSLLIAVLLWLAIVGEPEVVTMRTAPILFRNVPKDLLIAQDTIDSVRLELRGAASRVSSAALSDLAIDLDLGALKTAGERTFTLSDGDLRLPDGVTFMRAIPSQIHLRVARRKSKDVPVEVRFSALPPAGYAIAHEEIQPERLSIAGPEARVDAIFVAQTDAIDLGKATAPAEFHVSTYLADPQVWFESPPAVTVRITIAKK